MKNYEAEIALAKEKFEAVLRSQLARNEKITENKKTLIFPSLTK